MGFEPSFPFEVSRGSVILYIQFVAACRKRTAHQTFRAREAFATFVNCSAIVFCFKRGSFQHANMSRATAETGENVHGAVDQLDEEDEVPAFEEIDKLTELAIGASDIKKYGTKPWRLFSLLIRLSRV